MKSLLIPTDFKLQSLSAISRLAELCPSKKLNIVLVHMLGITDFMGELEMLSHPSPEYCLISDEFYTACINLKRKYANSIEKLGITFFYGHTMAAFKNFLEVHDIGTIVKLNGYNFELLTKKSVDPTDLVYRSGKDVLYINVSNEQLRAVDARDF